jgi:hypothetical protein
MRRPRLIGQDGVGGERDQLRRVFSNVVSVARGPADVDPHVAADGPTVLLQPLQKRSDAVLAFRIVRGQRHQHADAPQAFALLRPHRKRPCDSRAAEQRDDLTSPHALPLLGLEAAYYLNRCAVRA